MTKNYFVNTTLDVAGNSGTKRLSSHVANANNNSVVQARDFKTALNSKHWRLAELSITTLTQFNTAQVPSNVEYLL